MLIRRAISHANLSLSADLQQILIIVQLSALPVIVACCSQDHLVTHPEVK